MNLCPPLFNPSPLTVLPCPLPARAPYLDDHRQGSFLALVSPLLLSRRHVCFCPATGLRNVQEQGARGLEVRSLANRGLYSFRPRRCEKTRFCFTTSLLSFSIALRHSPTPLPFVQTNLHCISPASMVVNPLAPTERCLGYCDTRSAGSPASRGVCSTGKRQLQKHYTRIGHELDLLKKFYCKQFYSRTRHQHGCLGNYPCLAVTIQKTIRNGTSQGRGFPKRCRLSLA